jgi:hypothetical protein
VDRPALYPDPVRRERWVPFWKDLFQRWDIPGPIPDVEAPFPGKHMADAMGLGEEEFVEALKLGGDPLYKDNTGATLLFEYDHLTLPLFQLLIACGVNMMEPDEAGGLAFEVLLEFPDIIREVLHLGFDPATPLASGRTLLEELTSQQGGTLGSLPGYAEGFAKTRRLLEARLEQQTLDQTLAPAHPSSRSSGNRL